jgi:hypothetical protein
MEREDPDYIVEIGPLAHRSTRRFGAALAAATSVILNAWQNKRIAAAATMVAPLEFGKDAPLSRALRRS